MMIDSLSILNYVQNCPDLDLCAVLEIQDVKVLDKWMGRERRIEAQRRLCDDLTKGAH